MVEPVEAQSTDLRAIVNETKANNYHNQIWFVNYGKDRQGFVVSDQHVYGPLF